MIRFSILSILFIGLTNTTCFAQAIVKKHVPDVIEFAGMQLTLTPGAKRKIEADVTMIHSNVKYLQQKIDRANLYFPIIERVFHEEGFPEEFKYLALQESSLVSDAVSSSNAVGYWQFKKESAIEVGLRVDAEIDERMHIVYASRGAAKYLKKNNLLLNNWIYALLSYNLGAGGVKTHVKTKYCGEQRMLIDEDMHWYVLRFLAHKIAYEDLVGKAAHPALSLVEYTGIRNKSLNDISKQSGVSIDLIKEYNKWCTRGHVPNDKEYIVIIPVTDAQKPTVVQHNPDHTNTPVTTAPADKKPVLVQRDFPDIKSFSDSTQIPAFVSINGVKAIRADKGDQLNSLILKSGISREAFLHFNEMKGFEQIKPGEFYYIQLKRRKALVAFHTVQEGETIYDIAQKYAVTSGSIRYNNRMSKTDQLKPGRVLWLRKRRPEATPVEYKSVASTVPVVIKKDTASAIKNVEPVVIPDQQKAISPGKNTVAIIHTVQAGETVFSLSRKYNVDSDSIRLWNQLNGYAISINQELIVGYNESKPKEIIHTVLPGETAYKISKQYGVTPDEIKMWNKLPDFNLKPGQQLKILTD